MQATPVLGSTKEHLPRIANCCLHFALKRNLRLNKRVPDAAVAPLGNFVVKPAFALAWKMPYHRPSGAFFLLWRPQIGQPDL